MSALSPGQAFSHYRILRPLGAGGMGEVYLAEDTKLGRQVALKVLAQESARDPDRRARFDREARAIAALNHPNIVTLYSVEEDEGLLFITMELVDGMTLADVIPSHGMSLDALLKAAIPLTDAVGTAHQRGITHRDIKPANVMLAPGNRVVLMDFGIFMSERDALSQDVTGSPQYMAPETITNQVARGALYLVDIYAFGVLAFEVLTGDVPYKDAIVPKLLQQHMTAPIPDVCAARPAVSPRLGALVTELLAKEPRDRPQSMDEVAGELRAMLRAPERISLGPMRALRE